MIRFIPGLNLTIGKRMAISMGASIPFVGTCLLAAIKIGFPVPLMQQFAPIVIGIFTLPMIFLVLGTVLFATDSPLKAHADRYNRFFFSLLALCSAFPAYKLLFERIPVEYRGVAVIILPIWKLASKQFIVSSSRKLEDLMPVLVAFSVDFLSTLFIAACMSASRRRFYSSIQVAPPSKLIKLHFLVSLELRRSKTKHKALHILSARMPVTALMPLRHKSDQPRFAWLGAASAPPLLASLSI
ncbi:hypothetical protein PF006_g15433 [Phytophthora fragariae]|uniref:Uncharacterized protein n=1 Tax=Phytophthora fragariae TaxID=53985 RepID=A0A6A3T9H5_9STRA|nr:hypothetical protein PF006_g15433 [Phytophthora fragariae]